jgi:hypothetical protein
LDMGKKEKKSSWYFYITTRSTLAITWDFDIQSSSLRCTLSIRVVSISNYVQ